MPRSTPSETPLRSSKPRPKRATLGNRIETAALQAAAHLRGERVPGLQEYRVQVPERIDVAALRRRLNLSQAAFSRTYGIDLGALQAWEQNRRRPDRTARVLLAVIEREPEAVLRALTQT